MKSLIDQFQQRNENLVPNDFIYEDMLTVDENIEVMKGIMTDEEIMKASTLFEKELCESMKETSISDFFN